MKADKQTSKHLLLAVVITVFSVILILTIIVMEWEPWVVPLMATGCVGVWSLHIGRGDQARMYENLCAGLMASTMSACTTFRRWPVSWYSSFPCWTGSGCCM